MKHPNYPVRKGDPALDRCVCGGVRHWHAVEPHGCDDCPCDEFRLDEEATANLKYEFRAEVLEPLGPHVSLRVFVGPRGNSENVGILKMTALEAVYFLELS